MCTGISRSGDYIEITEHGGVVIYGRSDITLNPGGVRIGTAEIYRQVENISEVRVILFVKLRERIKLDDLFMQRHHSSEHNPQACACQDRCRSGYSLYDQRQESGTGRVEVLG